MLQFVVTGTDDEPVLTAPGGLDEKSVVTQLVNTGFTITATGTGENTKGQTFEYRRSDVTNTKHEIKNLKVKGRDYQGDGVIKFKLKRI